VSDNGHYVKLSPFPGVFTAPKKGSSWKREKLEYLMEAGGVFPQKIKKPFPYLLDTKAVDSGGVFCS